MDTKGKIIRIVFNLPLVGIMIYDIIRTVQTDGSYGVSVAAHGGGAFTGMTLGLVLLKNFKIKRWETRLELGLGILFCVVFIVMFSLQFVLK